MSRDAPRPLSSAVQALSARLAPATTLADVQRVWPRVVGEAIAREAMPERERAGVLSVTCSAAVWAQELDLMGPSVVAAINRELGREAVSSLRCRAGRAGA